MEPMSLSFGRLMADLNRGISGMPDPRKPGKHHLSATLLTLNVLAFLFYTVLQLVDERDQAMRQKRGTRKG
jgi:hypothetical protein